MLTIAMPSMISVRGTPPARPAAGPQVEGSVRGVVSHTHQQGLDSRLAGPGAGQVEGSVPIKILHVGQLLILLQQHAHVQVAPRPTCPMQGRLPVTAIAEPDQSW